MEIPLPATTPDGIAGDSAAWLGSAALTTLPGAFGFRPPSAASLAGRLAAISERGDYRQGQPAADKTVRK